MSELFQTRTHEETLGRIQERLGQGAAPAAVIGEMVPQSRDEALSWGRRLASWEEYRRQYPAQVVALARLVSLRAMREFSLMLREDGSVVERPAKEKPWKTPPPAAKFRLPVGGEEIRVEYTPGYFPDSNKGVLSFLSPHEPARPHALSETGYLSRFVPQDAVEACGGPEAYARLLAEALLRGQEKEFIEAFEGRLQGTERMQCRPGNRPRAEPGGHAERVNAEEEKTPGPPRQGMLF